MDLTGKQSNSIFYNGAEKIKTRCSWGCMVKLQVQHLLWPRWDLEWLYGCNWVLKDREEVRVKPDNKTFTAQGKDLDPFW